MAITTDVNVRLLNECYELRPFHGLAKPHESDIITCPLEARVKDTTPELTKKQTEHRGSSLRDSEIPAVRRKLSEFAVGAIDA
jgi:hypothetical protein